MDISTKYGPRPAGACNAPVSSTLKMDLSALIDRIKAIINRILRRVPLNLNPHPPLEHIHQPVPPALTPRHDDGTGDLNDLTLYVRKNDLQREASHVTTARIGLAKMARGEFTPRHNNQGPNGKLSKEAKTHLCTNTKLGSLATRKLGLLTGNTEDHPDRIVYLNHPSPK